MYDRVSLRSEMLFFYRCFRHFLLFILGDTRLPSVIIAVDRCGLVCFRRYGTSDRFVQDAKEICANYRLWLSFDQFDRQYLLALSKERQP